MTEPLTLRLHTATRDKVRALAARTVCGQAVILRRLVDLGLQAVDGDVTKLVVLDQEIAA